MKKLTIIAVSMVCACALVTLNGCSKKESAEPNTTVSESQKGSLEKAGAALDKAAKDTGEAVKDAAQKTGEAVKEAAKDSAAAVDKAAKDASAAVKEATTPAEKK